MRRRIAVEQLPLEKLVQIDHAAAGDLVAVVNREREGVILRAGQIQIAGGRRRRQESLAVAVRAQRFALDDIGCQADQAIGRLQRLWRQG